MASVNNVCRLCLSKDNLVWVFDKRYASGNNLKDVVFVTTGVEVYKKDVISQKICNKCCQIAIKMFEFRNVSQKHDKYLKKQYSEILKTLPAKVEIPTTSEAVKTEKKMEPVEPMTETKEVKPNFKFHQSVTNLYEIYPRLKLPTACMKSDLEPWVMMEMDAVENYLKKVSRNEPKRVRLSKPENKTAKKSTSAASITIDPLLISSRSVARPEKICESDRLNKIAQKKSEFAIVSVTEINENKSSSFSDEDAFDKIIMKPKKRRLSDSDFCSNSDATDSSSSSRLPKKTSINGSADKLCLDKSVPLFMCSICNSVHSNAGALRRHNYKHLRCQFCKSRFKTIDLKEAHIKSMCSIKNMMKYLPSVKLEKIELDLRMRMKYPAAFIDHPLIPGLHLHSSSTNDSLEDESSGDDHSDDRTSAGDDISGNMTSEKEKKAAGFSDDNDVIEIYSDDDTNSPNITQGTRKSTVTGVVSSVSVPSLSFTVAPVISTASSAISTTPSAISTTPSIIATTPSIIATTPPYIPPASSVISTTHPVISTTPPVIPSTLTPPVISMVPEDSFNSSCIVKPEIKIKRSTVLETIDPRLTDIKILKELLTSHTEFKFEKEGSSQTELPGNHSICVNESDNSTELKHLKNVLFAYKIPISIRKGDFQVRYDFNCTKFKTHESKKLCLWNDLIPIDVKVVNESINKEGPVRDKISVINSAVTSPNFTSNCTRTPTFPCNSSFIAVPNQQLYGRNNSFSTPMSSFNGSSNVQVYPQVVSSNYGFVNGASGSNDLAYVLVRTNPTEQQSTTNMINSFTAPNAQMYPQSANVNSSIPSNFGVANKSVVNDPTNVRPGANSAGLRSYANKMRGPPNINPFLNVAVPKTSPGTCMNTMNNAPPNVGNSHSMIYNLQNSLVIQNKVPNSVPNLVPISSASGSNEAAPVFGSIRVKNVWELT